MKSRQRIKILKLFRIYDRRGKKYNNEILENLFEEYQSRSIRRTISHLYDSRKSLKKYRSGLKMKAKIITHITD